MLKVRIQYFDKVEVFDNCDLALFGLLQLVREEKSSRKCLLPNTPAVIYWPRSLWFGI